MMLPLTEIFRDAYESSTGMKLKEAMAKKVDRYKNARQLKQFELSLKKQIDFGDVSDVYEGYLSL